ncbi:MAG: hypothetical protein EAX91_01180 [Candidatus Lokiarchaeota archaeon]|nr:hypothetical protein [Candidatus Lokiarchaeota archaeon]
MKVLLENTKEIENEVILITIRLTSGQVITLESELYKDGDMKDFVGKEIDVLLSGFRSPISEYRLMPENNSPFELEGEYYQFDVVEELERKREEKVKKNNLRTTPLKKLGPSALIIEGTFIPKYFRDPKWKRRKLVLYPDGGPAFDTDDGVILLSPFHLEPKIPFEAFPKRFKMFLSLGLVDWTVEGHERKLLERKPIYENTDKTFRIFIKNIKAISASAFSGYIEIYLGEYCLIYEPFPVIHINALVKGITENILSESDNDDWEDDCIVVRGCGHLGCCAGLFWDLIHVGDEIRISNIRWTQGRGYPIEDSVEGVYIIKLEEYKWEVLKLKEFCDTKSNNLDYY